jgi:hypothetical protein
VCRHGQPRGIARAITDQFDEAIALLGDGVKASANFEAYELLPQAFLARETTADTRSARDAAMRAFELATTNFERASALTSLGKASIR